MKNRLWYELLRLRAYYRFRDQHEYSPNLPVRRVKRILAKHDLGFQRDGHPTWWYQSLDLRRNEEDDLTRAALRFIDTSVAKDSRVLITGCGTGWMLIWIAQRGFRNLEGFDYLDNVVQAAQEIAALGKVNAKLWRDDGFNPKLDGEYDLILALHWLYSAWMGNYGNVPRGHEDREALLESFLARYTDHLTQRGLIMVELIDSISDLLEPPTDIYPVRHSLEQVELCAARVGLGVERRMFTHRAGHLPRMLYFLRKGSTAPA